MPAIQEKKAVWQKLIKCRQRQWTSGMRKEEYCRNCEVKKLCNAVLGR